MAVPSTTDVPISFSDSGIDSSASHQTILNTSTSGRTSSLSNRTDSSIVIPNSETHVCSSIVHACMLIIIHTCRYTMNIMG